MCDLLARGHQVQFTMITQQLLQGRIRKNIYELQSEKMYLLIYVSAQGSLRSVCACAQSHQSFHCSHEETMDLWLSTMPLMKILIRILFIFNTLAKAKLI